MSQGPTPEDRARQLLLAIGGDPESRELVDRAAREIRAAMRMARRSSELRQAPAEESSGDPADGRPQTNSLHGRRTATSVPDATATTDLSANSLEWDVRTATGPAEGAAGRSDTDGIDLSQGSELYLDELRRIAQRANTGPWRREGHLVVGSRPPGGDGRPRPVAEVQGGDDEERDRNAAFVSTFDPPMALALLFLNRQLEMENADLTRDINETSVAGATRSWRDAAPLPLGNDAILDGELDLGAAPHHRHDEDEDDQAPSVRHLSDLGDTDSQSMTVDVEALRAQAAAGATVLVVDDEAMVRDFVVTTLEQFGYSATGVTSVEDAIALLDGLGTTLKVLVTDIRLAQMDGWELAERVRDRIPGLRVLFVSGYLDESGPDELANLSSRDSVLAKPFTVQQLLGAFEPLHDE